MNRTALARIDYGLPSAPDVLVIAADPSGALRDIEAVEARCSAAVTLADAGAWLEGSRVFDLALLEIDDEAHGEEVEELFAGLQRGAELGRFASVVSLPPALIDFASAALDHPAIRLLVAPDAAERRVAITAALPARGTMRVFDGGADTGGTPADMREEVARIARRLAILAAPTPQSHAQMVANDVRVDAASVRSIIRARRLRDHYFEAELFADPAWDMLLDLIAARLEGRDVAVSSLCIAAAVPPTTALRWIKILTDAGLFVRRADPADKRRIFIALGDNAADAMLCYLAAMQRSGAVVA